MARLITFVAANAFLAVMGMLLFFIAGTAALPWVWVYLGLRVVFTTACVLAMSESVAAERLKPAPGGIPQPVYNALSGTAWVLHFVLAPLDLGRFHWSAGFPAGLHWLGVVGVLCGQAVVVWALVHNEYMSAQLRLQEDRGQRVIDSGPYAHIRHPNYAGGVLMGLSGGLVFGSWIATLPLLLWVFGLCYRSLQEERLLLDGLDGYAEYLRRVRWRFLPGVW